MPFFGPGLRPPIRRPYSRQRFFSSDMVIPPPWCSARDEHMRKDSVLANGHQSTVEDALGVLAAGVYAQRPTDLNRALGLVDVAVQPQERLVLLNSLTYRLAPDGHLLNPR